MKNKKIIAILTATICCACSVSATINPFISMADDNSVENIINIEYTFDDVYSMTTEEVASIFAEKGLTQDNGYYVYGQGEDAKYISNHECGVYLFSTDFLLNQTVEELADKYPSRIQGICLYDTNEIIWNEEKICHSLDLPEEFFDVTVFTRRINVKGVDSTDKYMFSCDCEIKCKIFDEKEYAAMRNALLNYVQLRSDFDALYIEEEILNYDKENEVIQKNAEAIVEYFYNNDIKGGVSIALPSEVITVVYYGEYEDQIKAYVAELGIDENMIVYEPHALSDYIGMDLDDMEVPLFTYAENTFKDTYSELLQMTDEEISAKYGLSEFSFGDESIPDETKFAAYLNKVPDWYIGDNYESESYSAYKKFIKGENVPYIVFTVDRYTALNDTLTAENFGYPKEWNFVVYDGIKDIEMGVPRQFHEYRLEIPLDIISDFEKYVRLKLSYDYFKNGTFYDENPYGITAFNGIEQQFVSYGETVSNIYGDSNCDFNTDLADAILIMQALANPNKYGENGTAENHLTKQGKTNGDMDGDGLTVGDAQIIQDILLGL